MMSSCSSTPSPSSAEAAGPEPRGRLLASFLRACRGRDVLLALRDGRVLEGRLMRYRGNNALRDPDAVVLAARAEGGAVVTVSLPLASVAVVIPASASRESQAGGPALAGGAQR